ncbi:hypothetical protein HAX54_050448, partial [Datura stramonium]|nr:hypothetical protein [Datura stramonium]
DESITFKVWRGHLFPIGVRDICVANDEQGVGKVVEHVIVALPKRKKALLASLKQYLCGTKGRKWVRKSHPKDGSTNPLLGIFPRAAMLNQALLGRKPK